MILGGKCSRLPNRLWGSAFLARRQDTPVGNSFFEKTTFLRNPDQQVGPKRATPGGMIYHVLNRANARLPIFETECDYAAFETVLAEGVERTQTRLLCYCLMNNHWHLVIRPREDGELSRFVAWLTLTNA